MSAASGPSARERIVNAANLLFASSVPIFASSTSHFDVIASTTPDHRGIQVKLQQWHRVGDTSLRCIIAVVGPPKASYRDALNALADDLDRMVAQSTTHHQQTFTPIRFSAPVPALAMMAGNSNTSPRTPTTPRRRQDLLPSFLTPRAHSASMAQSPRSRSSSTSSTSTIRPSTAPPGPGLPHTHTHTEPLEALPPMPTALPPIPTVRLTPKRSLTTRLTPFLRRQQRDAVQPQQQQEQLQPQTPGAQHQIHAAMEQHHRTPSRQKQHQHQPERKPSTLHKLGSLIKTNKEQQPQQQPKTPSTPRYMLAPDQGPSPSPSPTPPLKNRRRAGEADGLGVTMRGMRLMAPPESPVRQMTTTATMPPPTTSMVTTDRPRGPRELPQTPFGGEQRRTSSHEPPMLFAERSPAVRMKESSEWRRTSSRDSREYQQQQIQQQTQPAVMPPWKGGAPRDAAAAVVGTKAARRLRTTEEESALGNIANKNKNSMPAPTLRLQRKPVAYGSSGKYDGVLAPATAAAAAAAKSSEARVSKAPTTVWEEIDEWKEELLRDRERDRLRHQDQEEAGQQQRQRLTWSGEQMANEKDGEGNDDDDDADWEDETAWQHPGPPPPRSPARRHHQWPPLRSSGSSGLRARSSVDGKQ